MANENEKDQPENNHEEESRSENLEEQLGHPSEGDENTGEEWRKEVLKIPDEIKENDESWDDLSAKEGDLPDWIDEISQENGELTAQDQPIHDNLEIDEAIINYPVDDSLADESNDEEQLIEKENPPSLDNNQKNEDFLEISDYEIHPDISSEAEDFSDEMIDEDEQLPEWLEEMIEEPADLGFHEVQLSAEEQISIRDDVTKPLRISNLIEDEPQQTPEGEIVEESILLSRTTEDLQEIKLSEEEQKEREDQPFEEIKVETPPEIPEVSGEWLPEESLITPTQREEVEFETEFRSLEVEEEKPILIPKTLRFAKYLLDQGEIDPAYEIFQTYIKKPQHLEDIKGWIIQAISAQDNSGCQLWELLGDIEQKQGKHKEALSSYTRAISILISKF